MHDNLRRPHQCIPYPAPRACMQTLMSVDADRLVNLCISFHDLWSLPAQIAIALWLLYTQVPPGSGLPERCSTRQHVVVALVHWSGADRSFAGFWAANGATHSAPLHCCMQVQSAILTGLALAASGTAHLTSSLLHPDCSHTLRSSLHSWRGWPWCCCSFP